MQQRLSQRIEQQQQTIDMSPLLDVVFILLIFFIVTTVFVRETGVEVDKPQAVSANQLQQMVILLAITDQGSVYYDNSNIGVAGVRPTVEQLLRERSRPVVLQVDKNVSAELLVSVLDAAKLAGAPQVSLATVAQ
ncbi:ExbD/TolR family protein [Rheinheimera baltica]|uniref:Biopolymer transporter ExbD n=1 Tax=Rheinheimera baltica TaxID=67576 RepID=A0ABT9HXA1_9GAMM|nr:biopolymer transporter ExbD [Rheinheimera baltica]MDP5135763.1 biopolymer transporter ExbD [Rheinheimera baltica]MDP5142360.1 biopolymer transporter ExbD [Rheinheimera baltica]MDP5150738.1 biopolymer transporter ExbD [Rheinheimera baltica]MDP5188592.1 biopolymer transporter ExbD [Rheinheimera baltica]